MRFVVDAARLAPSRGNGQPWRFSWDGARLWLHVDPDAPPRSTDIRREETLLAAGAALENLALAAAARQLEARVTPFPLADDQVLARVHLVDSQATRVDAELWPQVRRRATFRGAAEKRALRGGDVLALVEAARSRRTRLELCLFTGLLHELAAALGRAEALRLDHPLLRAEALASLHPPESSPPPRRGLDPRGLELPPGCLDALREGTPVGERIQEHVAQQVLASSAVGVLSVDEAEPSRLLRAGRAMQRIWLAATERGLSLQPLTMPDTLLRVAQARPHHFDAKLQEECASLREVVDRAFPSSAPRRRLLTFRLVHAEPGQRVATRRPLQDLLELGGPAQLTGIAEA